MNDPMTNVQKIELGSFAAAGFCSVVAPAVAPTHPLLAAIIGGIGAAALATKGYLSSSPKDSNKQAPEQPAPIETKVAALAAEFQKQTS